MRALGGGAVGSAASNAASVEAHGDEGDRVRLLPASGSVCMALPHGAAAGMAWGASRPLVEGSVPETAVAVASGAAVVGGGNDDAEGGEKAGGGAGGGE